jgi:putative serine protease PepD
MSDEQREQGRDASAATDRSRTDQHPVPSYAGAPGQATPEQQAAERAPDQYGPAGPWQAEPVHAAGHEAPGAGYPGPGYQNPGPPAPPAGGSAWPPSAPFGSTPYPPNGQHTAVMEKPRKAPRTMVGIVAAALIAGVVGGAAGFGGAYALLDNGSSGPQLTQSPSTSNASNAVPGSVAAAATKAMPSTVDIQVNLAQGTAEGSGVILTADGDVLTNNHVVAGATGPIGVTLADGSQHQATVLGTSPSYDLAVIKIQGVSGLTPAVLGQSSNVQVGQQVVAIGSPQGLTGTVTSGIVSAFNRTVAVQSEDGSSVVYNGLQTDAPINPGNSGGPLVNLDGQVVGINSAIATASSGGSGGGGSIGLGFAIPVDQAKRVAQEIMNTGTATKPVLGVQGSVGGQTAAGSGAQIAAVQPDSPAAKAGLVAGDVVTKVGDAKVEDFSDLVARIGANAPGAQVTLTVMSGGSAKTVQVTLGSQPDKAASTGTGGENANPFGGGGRSGNGSGGGSGSGGVDPFNPFGGGN